MSNIKHIIIFSHGFGVRKDARGLFPDIISGFSDIESVMFDYNEIHEADNAIFVRPLSVQADMLRDILSEVRKRNPESVIDIVCHSRGAVVAALARPNAIRKIVFIAPPFDMDYERAIAYFKARTDTHIDMKGISRLIRRDGSVTFVPAEYWSERNNIDPIGLYNELALRTELIIVRAGQDEIVRSENQTKLSEEIKIIELPGDHNFIGETRTSLARFISECVS